MRCKKISFPCIFLLCFFSTIISDNPKHDQLRKEGQLKETRAISMQNVNPNTHPCLTCGACCAYYRASFYWAELDEVEGGSVPAYLTQRMDDFRCMMKGTNGANPRCIALRGTIGESVYCSIYERRSSVCRDFLVSWEPGLPNERCDKARLAWGLQPLSPEFWHHPDKFRRAA